MMVIAGIFMAIGIIGEITALYLAPTWERRLNRWLFKPMQVSGAVMLFVTIVSYVMEELA